MWATSMVCVQVKSAEINSLSSCEIYLIVLWQVQDADSVDTKGNCDLWGYLLLVRHNWPLADGMDFRAGGWRKEISKDK